MSEEKKNEVLEQNEELDDSELESVAGGTFTVLDSASKIGVNRAALGVNSAQVKNAAARNSASDVRNAAKQRSFLNKVNKVND